MSVIAEFTVPANAFALADTMTSAPEMTVEVERIVAHNEDRVMPYLWIRGGDHGEFEAAVEADPTVRRTTKLDEYEDATLYRAEWVQNVESLVYAYTEVGATILDATGRADCWELRMRFDDEQLLEDFQRHCTSNDISFELKRLYHPSEPMAGGQYGLSRKQREGLLTALDSGYFDVPRTASMQDVADELGISQQSVSKLLRRAYRNITANALTVTHPEDDNTS